MKSDPKLTAILYLSVLPPIAGRKTIIVWHQGSHTRTWTRILDGSRCTLSSFRWRKYPQRALCTKVRTVTVYRKWPWKWSKFTYLTWTEIDLESTNTEVSNVIVIGYWPRTEVSKTWQSVINFLLKNPCLKLTNQIINH